jgi:hypothetical protein
MTMMMMIIIIIIIIITITMIHQQISIKYKLLDRNTPPYYRYKPKLVLESVNMMGSTCGI